MPNPSPLFRDKGDRIVCWLASGGKGDFSIGVKHRGFSSEDDELSLFLGEMIKELFF